MIKCEICSKYIWPWQYSGYVDREQGLDNFWFSKNDIITISKNKVIVSACVHEKCLGVADDE